VRRCSVDNRLAHAPIAAEPWEGHTASNESMKEFSLDFDPQSFDALDKFALLATQDYNLGGAGDWFGNFRGGLYGFYSRFHGVQRHYSEVHAWLPRIRLPQETEYHLSSILFHMDSAIECLAFAMNALGWASEPTEFHDVRDNAALRRVSPLDVVGDPKRKPPIGPKPGYLKVFPRFQAVWLQATADISRIRDLHDVSKHRTTVFIGGKIRSDPPNQFYETLGIGNDATQRTLVAPMAEILLKDNPRAPAILRQSVPRSQTELLEDLVPRFADLVVASATEALKDAETNITLNEREFRT
jgi:hypothetical protein